MEREDFDKLEAKLNQIEKHTLLSAKRVLTVEDVALLAGVSKRTIYRMTSANRIPYYCPSGKEIYFNRDEVEGWLLSNRHATDDELQTLAVTKSVTRKHSK